MKLVRILTAKWGDPDHVALLGTAEVEGVDGEWPFAVHDGYATDLGQSIWDEVQSGAFGPIGAYVEPEREPVVIIIPAVSLWERLTETEAELVAQAMATQPFRTRKMFETAATLRSDHELWPLLQNIAIELFGEGRTAELLAA